MTIASALNPEQLKAVYHIEGPILVLAGAGSGKTRIVTHRIAHLLEIGVPASEILALTFTNKAADEMRNRIKDLMDQYVLTSTFHALGARILRESIHHLGYSQDFTIYDEDDSLHLLRTILKEKSTAVDKSLVRNIKNAISNAKNELLTPFDLSCAKDEAKADYLLKDIYALYQERLQKYNALDFDDLLFLTVRLLKEFPDILAMYQNRWTFILIDEYQDTNHAQYILTNMLAAKYRNLCVVGDPDQSIYSWRGANIQNILHFEKDYPDAKQVNLEQNYRSTGNILKAANALIRHNVNRLEKSLWSDRGNGDKIGLYIAETEKEESLFIIKTIKQHLQKGTPLSNMVIFYRTNSQSRIFEDMLLKYQIPYIIIGGISFYQRKEIKDILALLRLIVSPSDFLSFARMVNVPKRGIGPKAVMQLSEAADKQKLPIFTLCEKIIDGEVSLKISQRVLDGMKNYVSVIRMLRNMHAKGESLPKILRAGIENSKYLTHLKEDPETYEDRRENLDELISKSAEWEMENGSNNLEKFLEELALKSNAEEKNPSTDFISLMTLHNGKGLEFPIVFIAGLEEDLFPHANAKDFLDSLEEERRLCYVGMTRAKTNLYLTASKYRLIWGNPRVMRPSRFIAEIPKEYIQVFHEEEDAAYGFSSENSDLDKGTVVLHKDFGQGIIQKSYQTSLGLTYDVFFEESRTLRSLVAKYAKLKKI
ncbi:MAG: UvrD-helicase domain-containing protein [Simkaniaceae bacterium]